MSSVHFVLWQNPRHACGLAGIRLQAQREVHLPKVLFNSDVKKIKVNMYWRRCHCDYPRNQPALDFCQTIRGLRRCQTGLQEAHRDSSILLTVCNESHRAAVGCCQMLLLATPRVTRLCRLGNLTWKLFDAVTATWGLQLIASRPVGRR